MKKTNVPALTVSASVLLIMLALLFGACDSTEQADATWQQQFDISIPDFDNVYPDRDAALAAGGGWYWTMNEDFSSYRAIEEFLFHPVNNPGSMWAASQHGVRIPPMADQGSRDFANWIDPEKGNFWCDDMVVLHSDSRNPHNNFIRIQARQFTPDYPHNCSQGICPAVGRMSSGIETRTTSELTDGRYRGQLFSQAFGFFEAEVMFPNADGLWSAFWLQSVSMGKVGNGGMDGAEIDIFESSFRRAWIERGENLVGACSHWDGYGEHHRFTDTRQRVDATLYDGHWHRFALKWTPWEYVFYVNDVPFYAADWGGVSRVAQYVRLTTELSNSEEGKIGPYGQPLGLFRPNASGNTDFLVNAIRMLQHTDFAEHARPDDYFEDIREL